MGHDVCGVFDGLFALRALYGLSTGCMGEALVEVPCLNVCGNLRGVVMSLACPHSRECHVAQGSLRQTRCIVSSFVA